MKTIIRKKGVNSYKWHLMQHDVTVESGDHVGPLAELTAKLKEKRAQHMARNKAREETAKKRATEAAPNPRAFNYGVRRRGGRPRKNAVTAPFDSVDNADL